MKTDVPACVICETTKGLLIAYQSGSRCIELYCEKCDPHEYDEGPGKLAVLKQGAYGLKVSDWGDGVLVPKSE